MRCLACSISGAEVFSRPQPSACADRGAVFFMQLLPMRSRFLHVFHEAQERRNQQLYPAAQCKVLDVMQLSCNLYSGVLRMAGTREASGIQSLPRSPADARK